MSKLDNIGDEVEHYIFTVNNISSKDSLMLAEDIVKGLLQQKVWFFSSITPLHSKLKKGDKVLVYLCGKNRRYFGAKLNIDGEIANISHNPELTKTKHSLGLDWFDLYIQLDNIKYFNNKIFIKPLIQELTFIKNKKNYGLNLRLPIINIPETDFRLISD